MVDKIKEYLNERIKQLEEDCDNWLLSMTHIEKGYAREQYLYCLAKKVELQEILIKIYEMESGDSNV